MTDRERLIELIIGAKRTDPETGSFTEYLADYLLANGVIVLPCKVGDTVYYITGIRNNIVKSAIVNEIILNCDGIGDLFVSSDTADFENSFDIFYLTREDAEKALKERENNGKL